ncbi:acyl-CoA thioesterase [Rhodanobacter spathiphylli]|uniref:4-hydroxybenzoyl-CoA thioesterase n=1 Tax=Rhodanobacter spathiphylli B39 TaxID=1163407 RepID=I4W406_9GAMM|nr:thioesterase family protein [Rhodanobacter spathiphylli]EIL94197.1 4-hydroxybenzoyl-CoA thioesterase [Rhodanobacter spathiphylli B39]
MSNSSTDIAESATGASHAPLFVASLGVRWRDLDAFNHVNNSNFLTYLEEARLQWLQHVRDWFSEDAMPVLAASELQYRRPIPWPASLHIELRCTRLGTSSMTIAHRIVDADDAGRLYCDGHVVMVWMNPVSGKAMPLPATIRTAAGVSSGG